jgi:hypothetical protein
MAPTVTALVGFAGWFLLLTFALGFYRTGLVLSGQKAANAFAPDGSDVSAFGRRLNRARDNCYETLPLFTALAAAAFMSNRLGVTDPWAMWVLLARIGQSVVHITSTSVLAVQVRFAFFLAQLAIYLLWTVQLLS